MPRPKTDSKERLIEAAARLFSQQGYHATGLSQIVKESGVPRGSVYFLFPGGKEEIAVEAFKQSSSRIHILMTQTSENSSSIAEWLQQITAHMAHALETSDYRSGSPLAAATFDAVHGEDDTLGDICHKAYDLWIEQATAILSAKFGIDEPKAHEMALSAIGAIEGAVILCRAKRSREPLAKITDMLIAWIDTQTGSS